MSTKTAASKADDPKVDSPATSDAPRRTGVQMLTTVERPEIPTVEDENKELYEEHGLDIDTGLPKKKEEGEPSEDVLDASTEGEDPPAEDAEDPPAPPPNWSEILIDSPQRINEIPVEERGVAIAGMQAAMRGRFDTEQSTQAQTHATALETERTNAADQAAKQIAEEQAVAKVDQMRKDDPDAYLKWEEDHPDQSLRYQEIKSGVTREPAPTQEPKLSPEAFARRTEAVALANALTDPDQKELTKLHDADPSRYNANDPNLVENVRADVRKVLAQKEDPAAKAAAARQEAAKELEETPKPDVSRPTSSATGALTWQKLKGMTTAEHAAYNSTPEGEAEVDKVLAAGP